MDLEYRRKRIDIIFPGEFSFSLAVPLRFAESQRVGRVGWDGTGGPGSQSCEQGGKGSVRTQSEKKV